MYSQREDFTSYHFVLLIVARYDEDLMSCWRFAVKAI